MSTEYFITIGWIEHCGPRLVRVGMAVTWLQRGGPEDVKRATDHAVTLDPGAKVFTWPLDIEEPYATLRSRCQKQPDDEPLVSL